MNDQSEPLNKAAVPAHEPHLRALLVRAQQGDAEGYHAFLAALVPVLRGFFRRRLQRWPDDVEDLLQETLLAVHNQRHNYDPALPATAWLYAIARYKLVDLLRRRGRGPQVMESLDDVDEAALAIDSEATTARRDVNELLARLPDKQRLPIVYMKVEGRSVVEVARLTGLSASAVKVNVHRGLKALAAMIRKDDEDR